MINYYIVSFISVIIIYDSQLPTESRTANVNLWQECTLVGSWIDIICYLLINFN